MLAYDQLVTRFESLGEDCEFGLVQRYCGAEPLGLLRFTGARLAPIIDVIATGGAHFFTEDDLNIFYMEGLKEFFITSKHYGDFHTHTFLSSDEIDEATLRGKRAMAFTFLKKKFFDEMRSSSKIYIRRGADSIVDLRRLHAALNAYGENTLLCLAEADHDHDAGTVEEIGSGLWRGYLSRFKNFGRDTPTDLVNWLRIMERIQRICDPGCRLERPRRLARGTHLQADPRFAVGANNAVLSRSRVSLHKDTGWPRQTVAFARADVTIEKSASIVFSIWIKIGDGFEAMEIVPSVDLPVHHSHPADLACRARWQKIWVTAEMSAGCHLVTVSIKAVASAGSTLLIGGWSIDVAPIPRRSWSDWLHHGKRGLERQFLRLRSGMAFAPELGSEDILQRSARAMAQGSFIEADDMLAIALADAPGDAALLKQYAFCAHNRGDYKRAIDRWNDALTAAPLDPMCHAGVAANFREIAVFKRAADLIADALALFPEDMIVLTEAARIAAAQNRYDDAADFYERAVALHGPHAEWLSARDEARTAAQAARVSAEQRKDLERDMAG